MGGTLISAVRSAAPVLGWFRSETKRSRKTGEDEVWRWPCRLQFVRSLTLERVNPWCVGLDSIAPLVSDLWRAVRGRITEVF
jgi:hypothetical protein